MTRPHINKQIQYYEDTLAWLKEGAPEGQEPWRQWEYMNKLVETWTQCSNPPAWEKISDYRRKPKKRTVGDISFPEPVREALVIGQKYWVADPLLRSKCYIQTWVDRDTNLACLSASVIHLTQEAAIAHAEAIIKFNGGTL